MASAIEQFVSTFTFSALSKAEDLKKRIWFTLMILVIYRFGTYVPLPGVNPKIIAEFTRSHSGGILGILDMFSGGAIGRMTVLSLNIMPYISASIIIQLATSIFPSMEAMKKEGETGKKKLNQYTRYLTVLIASFQGFGIAVGIERITGHSGMSAVIIPGMFFRLNTMITLVGGTLFVMWLGEQITSRGIGQGTSLIIASGILANLPQSALNTLEMGRQGILSTFIILTVLFGVGAIILFIVFMEKAYRKIPIQYPKRQTSAYMPATSKTTHIPLKINNAGVIPPIFSNSLLLLPTTIFSFATFKEDSFMATISSLFSHGQPLFIISSVCLIIFFSFFYTSIVLNPKETADNLKKSGAYIPGIRPGNQTAEYINTILTRLTFVGAVYLAFLCSIPELILAKIKLPFYLSGTSFLITIGVILDLINQFQSHLIAYQYEGLIKKNKKLNK